MINETIFTQHSRTCDRVLIENWFIENFLKIVN
jgi:hypothetical protein